MRLSLALFAAAIAAGCAPVGPDFVRPDAPQNPAWLEAEIGAFETSPAELVGWWRTLEDPVLDELIEAAHRHNNNLEIAGLRVLEAQANLGIATGLKYPQAQVAVGDATALGASESAANTAAGDLEFTQYNLGAGVSWELDFWGRFRRGVEAADAALLASVADYDDLLVLLTAQVVDVYVVVRTTEEQLRLAKDSLAIQERSYEIVDVLFRNGDSSELDALQAKTLLLSTRASIPPLEAALKQARNALAILLGETPGDIETRLKGEGLLPVVPETVLVGVPADLLRQRPDVRAAEYRARAQNALVGVATADLYPRTVSRGEPDVFGGRVIRVAIPQLWPHTEQHSRAGHPAATGAGCLSRDRDPRGTRGGGCHGGVPRRAAAGSRADRDGSGGGAFGRVIHAQVPGRIR